MPCKGWPGNIRMSQKALVEPLPDTAKYTLPSFPPFFTPYQLSA